MENMEIVDRAFWNGKKVFLTGHTGFKGSWLSLWLTYMGANVAGFSLEPPTQPSLFDVLRLKDSLHSSTIGDIRDFSRLHSTMQSFKPDIVIHMAAQPLVRYSYEAPVETFSINVMGTVNVLEAVRQTTGVRAVINVTTDKCYDNQEWLWGYREGDTLGGYDPYSNSKACSELVTSSYRNSFFHPEQYNNHQVALASARAGNVIGGGDWAKDRLIPDCLQALLLNEKIVIRNPHSIRPWQHVLEPLSGYLLLAQNLYTNGVPFAEAWNFGPDDADAKPVNWIAERICQKWGQDSSYQLDGAIAVHPHEAHYLKLDCSKAKAILGWSPRWSLDQALDRIIEWAKGYKEGADMSELTTNQIKRYMNIPAT